MPPRNAGDASQLAASSEQLLHDIRAFGRVPKQVRGSSDAQVRERNLAFRLRKARAAGRVSAAQEAELSDPSFQPDLRRQAGALEIGGSTGGLSRYLLDGYQEPDLASFLAKK